MVLRYQGKYLNFVTKKGWEYVDRKKGEGAVIILAVTPDEKLLLVEQFRIPVGKKIVELPAGLVNDQPEKGREKWEEAARRELLEETGYEAESLKYLTLGPTTPGLSSELVAFYLARGLKKVGKGGGDEHESLTVHEVPLIQIEAWLKEEEKNGALIDTKLYAGLYFLKENHKITIDH